MTRAHRAPHPALDGDQLARVDVEDAREVVAQHVAELLVGHELLVATPAIEHRGVRHTPAVHQRRQPVLERVDRRQPDRAARPHRHQREPHHRLAQQVGDHRAGTDLAELGQSSWPGVPATTRSWRVPSMIRSVSTAATPSASRRKRAFRDENTCSTKSIVCTSRATVAAPAAVDHFAGREHRGEQQEQADDGARGGEEPDGEDLTHQWRTPERSRMVRTTLPAPPDPSPTTKRPNRSCFGLGLECMAFQTQTKTETEGSRGCGGG